MADVILIRATISEVKNRLSAYLRRVRAGETVIIMDRKTPVATLGPVPEVEDRDPRLARLISAGLASQSESSERFVPLPVPVDVDLLGAVLAERRTGR